MIRNLMLILALCFASATLGAQATPAPPAPPPPPQVPPAAPRLEPPEPPEPPEPLLDFDFNFDIPQLAGEAAQLAAEAAQLRAEARVNAKLNEKLATIQPFALFQRRGTNDDRLYERGQNALDRSQWSEALAAFTEVASRGGSRADGALYWKAYTLSKLGRRDEALAAIADLRKSYASSRWLDDASALEIEIKQASGQNVSPENQPDEELKLMALNALVNSDPDRALPLLENLLKSAQSLRLKERALFVLAQSSAPRAQQLLEQIAKGNGNPDLQLKAIQYVGTVARRQGNSSGLYDIYTASNDENVRRATLRALMTSGDTDHLLQAVKAEKSPQLKAEGIRYLAGKSETGDALAALWATEQDQQVKRAILDTLHAQRNAKALVDLARTERDPEMKRQIVQRISTMKSKEATDYLLELLK
jgi:HEAT repeats